MAPAIQNSPQSPFLKSVMKLFEKKQPETTSNQNRKFILIAVGSLLILALISVVVYLKGAFVAESSKSQDLACAPKHSPQSQFDHEGFASKPDIQEPQAEPSSQGPAPKDETTSSDILEPKTESASPASPILASHNLTEPAQALPVPLRQALPVPSPQALPVPPPQALPVPPPQAPKRSVPSDPFKAQSSFHFKKLLEDETLTDQHLFDTLKPFDCSDPAREWFAAYCLAAGRYECYNQLVSSLDTEGTKERSISDFRILFYSCLIPDLSAEVVASEQFNDLVQKSCKGADSARVLMSFSLSLPLRQFMKSKFGVKIEGLPKPRALKNLHKSFPLTASDFKPLLKYLMGLNMPVRTEGYTSEIKKLIQEAEQLVNLENGDAQDSEVEIDRACKSIANKVGLSESNMIANLLAGVHGHLKTIKKIVLDGSITDREILNLMAKAKSNVRFASSYVNLQYLMAANCLAVGKLDCYKKLVPQVSGRGILKVLVGLPHLSADCTWSKEFKEIVKENGNKEFLKAATMDTLNSALITFVKDNCGGLPLGKNQKFIPNLKSLSEINEAYGLEVEEIKPAIATLKREFGLGAVVGENEKFTEVLRLISEAEAAIERDAQENKLKARAARAAAFSK